MDFDQLILNTNKYVKKNIHYSEELIKKFDKNIPFDLENYNYLINSSGKEGYFPWLSGIVKEYDAKIILELGNRYGCSTIALFSGMNEDQQLISVDIVKDQRYLPDKIIESNNFKCVIGDCLDLTIYQEKLPVDIDIMWSDTEHSFEQIQTEFGVYENLLADEALIIVDDIKLNDKFLFFEKWRYKKNELSKICHENGFGIFLYKRNVKLKKSKEQRIHDSYHESLKAIAKMKNVYEKKLNTIEENYFLIKGKKKIKKIYYNFASYKTRHRINQIKSSIFK